MSQDLPITVPMDLFNAVAEATSDGFARSELWNAKVVGDTIIPHTVTAYLALMRSFAARTAIKANQRNLVKPEPFPGHPPRPGVRELLGDWLAEDRPRARRRPEVSW